MQLTRKQWFATTLVALWAVTLVVAGAWSAHTSEPTVREQSDLAAGRASVDEAVAAVVESTGGSVRAQVDDLDISRGCQLTLAESGTELEQTVRLQVPEGQERATLERLVEQLPPEWQARYYPAVDRFFADAGEFVALRGGIGDDSGEVTLTAATGCRRGALE